MRGPLNAYAVNGHDRVWHAYSPAHVGTFSIYSTAIIGNVAGAHIEITRAQAAQVLRQWLRAGYTIRLSYNHYHTVYGVCGPKRCEACNGTDARFKVA